VGKNVSKKCGKLIHGATIAIDDMTYQAGRFACLLTKFNYRDAKVIVLMLLNKVMGGGRSVRATTQFYSDSDGADSHQVWWLCRLMWCIYGHF
jgi:hypothetical protein